MNSAQNQQVLKQYYMDAYQVARQPWGPTGAETDLIVVLQDGFMPMTWWGGFMTGNPYTNVWMDNHYYQAFTSNYGSMNAGTHIKVRTRRVFVFVLPLFVYGGWVLTVNDRLLALRSLRTSTMPNCPSSTENGRWACTGALQALRLLQTSETVILKIRLSTTSKASCPLTRQYDKIDALRRNYAVFTRAYFDVQTQAFENTGKGQGWFFWTWTNQANYTEWGYDLALQAGWFPTDPSQHASSESALCNVS